MDHFSTNYLTGVVNSLRSDSSFLADTFFPGQQTETSEEIHFDVEDDVMGLAPFVSPVVEGKVMSNLGYTTKTFKPAYVKPKHVFNPQMALKRTKGEQLGGTLSPEQRMRLIVAQHLMVQRDMLGRRLEWMAAQILATGSVTVTGDLYPTAVVNYGRAGGHTITLSGGARWGESGVDPLDDLQTWSDTMIQACGSKPTNVVMEVGAWKLFRKSATVIARIDLQRSANVRPTMSQDAIQEVGGTYMGTVDGFNIWVYSGYYKADNGTITPYMAANTVFMVGQLGGVQAFGAIQDEAANIAAIPYFSKSWVQQDPPRRMIMTQSAPLLVPYRPNASMAITVR